MITFGATANDDGTFSLFYAGRLVGHYARTRRKGTGARWRGVSIHGVLVYAGTRTAVESALMETYA